MPAKKKLPAPRLSVVPRLVAIFVFSVIPNQIAMPEATGMMMSGASLIPAPLTLLPLAEKILCAASPILIATGKWELLSMDSPAANPAIIAEWFVMPDLANITLIGVT